MGRFKRIVGASLVVAMGLGRAAAAQQESPEAIRFFEEKIRPVLVERCYKCHSAKAEKLKGGLLLDSRRGMIRGGESGSAIVPGVPEKSLIIQAIRKTHDHLQMPPGDALTAQQVADFEAWVRMGAPDPREGPSRTAPIDMSESRKFWSFQPPREHSLPEVKLKEWPRTPVDYFILERLEEKGLTPSPIADKRTLIRRASFDLIGLPPTPQEIEAFVSDESKEAFAKVIDRLQASPHFGERWARYWLDVARYAETKGSVDPGTQYYPFAYTYRDWVVRAFNEDLPFDRFILQQIAADRLPLDKDRRTLAALGFLTVGRRHINSLPDTIDDRIDVVTRGLLGLSVTCARCHDHKYDPIPTGDYYSLYGIFSSSLDPKDLPLLVDPPEKTPALLAFEKELAARKADLEKFCQAHRAPVLARLRAPEALKEYLLAATEMASHLGKNSGPVTLSASPATVAPGSRITVTWTVSGKKPAPKDWVALYGMNAPNAAFDTNRWASTQGAPSGSLSFDAPRAPATYEFRYLADDGYEDLARSNPVRVTSDAPSTGEVKLNSFVLERWAAYLKKTREGRDPLLAPWHAFAAIPEQTFREESPAVAAQIAARSDPYGSVNALVAELFAEPPGSLWEVAERYAQLLSSLDTAAAFPDADREALRQVLHAPEAPPNVPVLEIKRFLDEKARAELSPLEKAVRDLHTMHPGAPPRAMILEDSAKPSDVNILIRGNAGTPGPRVPRRFLEILSEGERPPFRNGSGRLELAQAVVDPGNPLTARVWVNRVWQHLFGVGLVSTPSDFGKRGAPPTHPELLDWLACRFMSESWSVKKLIRRIMLSSVYQQTTTAGAETLSVDPVNSLLGRMNLRRLDFEAIRDSFLAVTGELDLAVGGPSIDVTNPYVVRRALYAFIDRWEPQPFLRTFDVPQVEYHVPVRRVSTVPQQALFMMNNIFVMERARQLMRRGEVAGEKEAEFRIQALHRLLYGRPATSEEIALGLKFVRENESEPRAPQADPRLAWQYGIGRYDAAAQRVENYQALPHFGGNSWSGAPRLVDPRAGGAFLDASGGKPGGPKQAAIRRWTAPRDGEVVISGVLSHKGKEGDGVRACVLSSRTGEVVGFVALRGSVETKVTGVNVKSGDTLDFIVDSRADGNQDEFAWSLTLRMYKVEWDAKRDFGGPPANAFPLGPWELYAQVLLEANEFIFVN